MSVISRATEAVDGLVFRLLGRAIARRFVVFGGVPAVLSRGRELVEEGITPTYNRIDEHVRDMKRITGICESYVELVHGMNGTNAGNVAIKPSAFGMEFGAFVFARMLSRFIDAAKGSRLEIEVDAERRDTLYEVQGVLNVLRLKLPEGIIFRPAFQMHLPVEFRNELITRYRILDMPVRIVKGSGLYDVGAREVTDEELLACYIETFWRQMADKKHPNIAIVRDKKLLDSFVVATVTEQVAHDRFTIQFLDGPFGRSLAKKCVAMGYRVGCYVPFVDPSAPDEWKGYVKRRIAFGRKLMFGI